MKQGDLFPPRHGAREEKILKSETARDAGMERVLGSADRAEPNWSQRAFDYVVQFARKHPEFMSEDVREHAIKDGFPDAPDARAWGPVIRRVAIAGIIRSVGFRKQASISCHRSPKTVWALINTDD